MESPSFNTNSCTNIADIANRVVQELHNDNEFKDLICFSDDELNEDEENTQEDEFEFPLIFTDTSLTDNIIYNDQTTPRYPLFDRSLLLNLDSNLSNTDDSKPAPAPTTDTVSTVTPTSTPATASSPTLAPTTYIVSTVTPTSTPVTASSPTLAPATNPNPASPPSTRLSLSKLFSEDRESTQSSTLVVESNDFNTISPETYCVWKPQEQEHQPPKHHSRGKHKKSNSISISEDTSSKRWKVRDLLKRSYSDDSKHTSSSSSSVVVFSPPHKPKTVKDGSLVVVLPPISPKPSNEKVKKPEKALKTTASSMSEGCTNYHKPENKTPAYKAKIGNIRLPAFLPYRQDQHQVDAFSNHTNGPIKHMYRY